MKRGSAVVSSPLCLNTQFEWKLTNDYLANSPPNARIRNVVICVQKISPQHET